jgi:alkylhydroperoxidase/carboxymuconolactone decarboxylase family protein
LAVHPTVFTGEEHHQQVMTENMLRMRYALQRIGAILQTTRKAIRSQEAGNMNAYYESEDLKKFSSIARVNKPLGGKFFACYADAMQEGALTEREKALIVLAVAHELKCPYCIYAYTQTGLEEGADEEQMNEAVHVAAAMAAEITSAHGVQVMNSSCNCKGAF